MLCFGLDGCVRITCEPDVGVGSPGPTDWSPLADSEANPFFSSRLGVLHMTQATASPKSPGLAGGLGRHRAGQVGLWLGAWVVKGQGWRPTIL